MKKIVWLLMSAMALSLAISCNEEDNDKLVGGEDVADPRLNPGGTLMDGNVNIVGAWALCHEGDTPKIFCRLDSKGKMRTYYSEEYTMDSMGIIGPCSGFDYRNEYTWELEPYDPITSMLELVCIVLEEDHSFIYYCPFPDDEQDPNYTYQDYERDSQHKKTIDKKAGEFLCTWEDEGPCKRKGTIKTINVDSYIINIEEKMWYGNDSYKLYIRRIKGFSE